MHKHIVPLVLVWLLLIGSGCARASQQEDSADLRIKLAPIPFPPVIGDSRLVVQIADNSGSPVDDAHMVLKGSMSHAGMVPVLVEVEGGGKAGVYNVPFEWTMAGDWIVAVDVQLADGTVVHERFDIAVLFEDDSRCEKNGQEP